jgi:hypothetical protein
MHIGYWWESQKETDHWEDRDVGGWTILKWIFERIGWDGVDWMDRDQWRALVNTVLNLRGSIKCWEVLEGLHNWRLLKKGSAP